MYVMHVMSMSCICHACVMSMYVNTARLCNMANYIFVPMKCVLSYGYQRKVVRLGKKTCGFVTFRCSIRCHVTELGHENQ